MASFFIWIVTMAVAISTLAIAAAAEAKGLHVAVAAVIALGFVALVARENSRPISSDAEALVVANANARFMGAIWAFSASAIALTYGSILQWGPWQLYVLGLSGIAVLCLCSANLMTLGRSKEETQSTMQIARILSIVQLVGSTIAIVGFWWSGKAFGGSTEWAANNILLFSSLSIAILSIFSLRSYANYLQPATSPARTA